MRTRTSNGKLPLIFPLISKASNESVSKTWTGASSGAVLGSSGMVGFPVNREDERLEPPPPPPLLFWVPDKKEGVIRPTESGF